MLPREKGIGSRLTEERKRFGLRQAEFARLTGASSPKQSLYETGKRQLRAAYLARLAEMNVDVLYVLTGARNAVCYGAEIASLLTSYHQLPPDLRRSLVEVVKAMSRPPKGRR